MAKGKKTGGRDFEPGHPGMGGRPKLPDDIKEVRKLANHDVERALYELLYDDHDGRLKYRALMQNFINEAIRSADPRRFEIIMDRILGKPKEIVEIMKAPIEKGPMDFTQFCVNAGYPKPFPKQLEMLGFGLTEKVPRLLLGSRGYGKTDYVTILGIAYDIYLNRANTSNLIISKSKVRNTAMIEEIANALRANGVQLEKSNSTCVRVQGMQGKDQSAEVITIKTSMRGRHPKRIVMDDPVTDEDTSEATRVLVKKKYNEAHKLCSDICIIGQPAHKDDLYADLRGIVKTMEVPHGMIPELDHDLEAQRLAGVDEASISASYFLKVLSEGVSPFGSVRYSDQFPTGDSAVAFIDPSFEGGDYTAISIIKMHMQAAFVVGFVYKKAWNHCLDEIVAKLQKYNVQKLAFETNSLGDLPISMLRQLLPGMGVVGRRSNTNKHSRIMAAGSYAHMIHLAKESDKVYIDQVVKYEYKAKHDDAPDSLASCLEWIGLIRGKE